MNFRKPTAAALLLFAAATPAAAGNVEQHSVLDAGGEPLRLIQGTYGELFPAGGEAAPGNPVLALERGTEEAVERRLVPGTEGPARETEFSLLYDKTAASLFVFWESRHEDSSALYLVSRDPEGEWSEAIEVSGNPFGWKSAPRLAVTQEASTRETPEGGSAVTRRTILHLVWAEERPAGDQVFYAPVVLENGSYIGANPVLALEETAGEEGFPEAPEAARALVDAPVIAAGRDGRSVIVVFAGAASRSLVAVEIEALSRRLESLAGGGRAHITIVGARASARQRLAQEAHDYILSHAAGFHPAVVSYIAERARDAALGAGDPTSPADPDEIARAVWEEIVRAGVSIEDQGLLAPLTPRRAELLEFGGGDPSEGDPGQGHLLRIETVSVRPAPETPEAPTRVFVSPSGREVVVGWSREGFVAYRETQGAGWSEVQRLALGPDLTAEDAWALLEGRVRSAE